MKILIVEDEKKTGEYLTKGLTEAGFVVDLADNGLNGYHLAMTGDYDLLILDIMLPDVNGWDIVRMLRAAGKGMPILLLTALGTIEHRVKGLELGADDYLVKPFAFAELLARVRARLRTVSQQADSDVLRIGNLELDRLRRQVRRAGKPVELTAREFDVLALLAQWRGQPVSRDLLAREVWKVNRRLTPLDNVIDVHLSHLRDKIDRDQSVKLIQTVRGVGIRLAEGAE